MTELPPCYIFDMDGVLVDNTVGLQHVAGDTPDWDAFNRTLLLHEPRPEFIQLANHLHHSVMIAVVTCRSEQLVIPTSAWLEKHGVLYDLLLMRGPDVGYEQHKRDVVGRLRAFHTIVMAFEDDPRHVATYKELEVPVVTVESCWTGFGEHLDSEVFTGA